MKRLQIIETFFVLNVLSAIALRVEILVKETQGVRVNQFPVQVVVPLPKGNKYAIDQLSISGVPSQVEVLERWPSDNSLRNVLVHFQRCIVSETGSVITVNTGKIRFNINKATFNLIDELWVDQNGDGAYSTSEQVVVSNVLNGGHLVPRSGAGGVQYDSGRTDVVFRIEERGPMRVVIRAEAFTKFVSTTDHQHGFAVRLYAYANLPYIKVDYQLQNSAKNVKRSWPLYLEAMNLDLRVLALTNPSIIFGSTDGSTYTTSGSASMAQTRHDEYAVFNGAGSELKRRSQMRYTEDYRRGTGFMHLAQGNVAVTAIGRNFWQMWPNGLKFQNSKLTVELFPSWSAQWERGDKSQGILGRTNPTGLYWLKDMQHVYKETLFVFHPSPPTRAALDLGGYIPARVPSFPTGRQAYDGFYTMWDGYKMDPDDTSYSCNVRVWGDPEVGYRDKASTAGGTPYWNEGFIVSGDPQDYFLNELMAIGELNVRPEWMAGYNYTRDQGFLALTTNPYPPDSWRVFDGHGISVYAADLLPGTINSEADMVARDDAHGWFYHVAQSYVSTGNLWVKDWYAFIAEFRKVRLNQGDPFPPMADREIAHAVNHAYQAARVVGDPDFGPNFRRYLRDHLRPAQDLVYGQQFDPRPTGGGGFQTGYVMRTFIAYLELVRDVDVQGYAEAFQYLSDTWHGICITELRILPQPFNEWRHPRQVRGHRPDIGRLPGLVLLANWSDGVLGSHPGICEWWYQRRHAAIRGHQWWLR
ncbi:Beta-L-arabinofuranosidase [Fragilaria crotonensis]|nr:Beta-L-arabinofuranosidase [Fragilaria crotonensis]